MRRQAWPELSDQWLAPSLWRVRRAARTVRMETNRRERSALLVIDAQDSFKLSPTWARRDNPRFESNVAALLGGYRAARLPVVFFLHTDPDPGFQETSPHFRVMPGLEPREGEPVFVKRTRNCFTSTPLQPWLLERGVGRIAIAGIQTEQCCETTARVGADLGFAVDFITEATMTFPIAHLERPGEELGVEAIRERTEYALRGRFARIVTVETVLAELSSWR